MIEERQANPEAGDLKKGHLVLRRKDQTTETIEVLVDAEDTVLHWGGNTPEGFMWACTENGLLFIPTDDIAQLEANRGPAPITDDDNRDENRNRYEKLRAIQRLVDLSRGWDITELRSQIQEVLMHKIQS